MILDKQHSNSHLACLLLSKHITDPTLYHIMQCIKACRNMVTTFDPDQQAQFYRMTSRHTCKHTEVWGPSGALAYNLSRLGWKLLPTGMIDTDTRAQFHLLHSCKHALMAHLERSWMRHITQCELHRPEWTNLPVPDRRATLRCFADSDPTTHATTANILAGTSMLASQIKHFGDTTEHCELCGEVDSYLHRALECTATADVRANFPDIIDEVQSLDPSFVHLPVVNEPPHADFHQWYFQHVAEPALSTDAQHIIQAACELHHPITVLTDGTCDHPHIPLRRRAGFSVVIQQATSPQDQADQIMKYRTTGSIPAANIVASLGEVPGPQNIGRAELAAIKTVAQWDCPVNLWTDSQYSIDSVHLLQSTEALCLLHNKPNFDLLTALWHHVRRPDFVLRKIKSHSLDIDNDPQNLTWAKLGNEAADHAAKQFLKHLQHNHPLDLDAHDHTAQVARCQHWYRYMHQLQIARAKLFQTDAAPQPMGHAKATWNDHLTLLRTWEPPNTWQFEYTQQYDEVLDDCIWGSQYTDQLLQWASQIAWPLTERDDEPYNLGITWYELAVSFCLHTQRGIVVNAGGQHRDFRPFAVPLNSPEVPWAAQVQAFERALNHIQSQLVDRIFPDSRGMARGIRVLGASHAKHGLLVRPCFPHQTIVCDTIQAHMQTLQQHPTTTHGPHILQQTPGTTIRNFSRDDEDLQNGWHLRAARTAANRRRR